MKSQAVKFESTSQGEFFRTLRNRVDDYLSSNNIKRSANANMIIKSFSMLAIYFVPYALMLSGIITPVWLQFLMWFAMGVGMAGIGLCIMHDANHGSYFKNTKVNRAIAYIMEVVGGSSINWRIQHNVLHHTYTNIDGMDEDIDPIKPLLRFSPHAKLYKIHRLQHLYAWFLYGLMTIMWCTSKDFTQLAAYNKAGLLKGQNTTYAKEIAKLIVFKLAYFGYALVLPMILVGSAWWIVLLGFILMHYVAGFILACVFQPAHVMESSEFPIPKDGSIEQEFAAHQLYTTTNFAPNSKLFSWYVGGLNFQIEHHLFPNICHVHYKKLAPIVERTAKEFGLPYHVHDTFIGALWNHGKMLKALGR